MGAMCLICTDETVSSPNVHPSAVDRQVACWRAGEHAFQAARGPWYPHYGPRDRPGLLIGTYQHETPWPSPSPRVLTGDDGDAALQLGQDAPLRPQVLSKQGGQLLEGAEEHQGGLPRTSLPCLTEQSPEVLHGRRAHGGGPICG